MQDPISLIYWYWGTKDAEESNEGQLLGKWWVFSNPVFRIVNCV